MHLIMNRPLAAGLRKVFAALTVISLVVPFWVVPTPANAATILTDGFGTGDTVTDVPNWEDGRDTDAKAPGSGGDTASPDGGRFAKIANDEYICRVLNGDANANFALSYYWRGDTDAENNEYGKVEVRKSNSCTSNDGNWVTVNTHELDDGDNGTDEGWSSLVNVNLPTGETNQSKFALRFKNTTGCSFKHGSSCNNEDGDDKPQDEFFRIDGVSVTSSIPETTLPLCTNGQDDDGDSQVDLVDSDCAAFVPKLTVTKVVTNNNGGNKDVPDFPLFVDQTSVTSGVQNTFAPGTYTVSETNQSGYTATITGDCAANGSITLAAGDVKTCTITNDDNAPVDVCPSLPGVQEDVPSGYHLEGEECVEDPVDVCSNLNGVQLTAPQGTIIVEGECLVDVCPNIRGAQPTLPSGYSVGNEGECIAPVDVCPNIENVQTQVPSGLIVNEQGSCVEPPAPPTGSITVCKVVLDAQSNPTADIPGTTFTIPGLTPDPVTSQGAPVGVIPNSVFTTPIVHNTTVFGNAQNAQCVTYSGLTLGGYYYGQEQATGNTSGWLAPKYSDQFTVSVDDASDLVSYSGQLFDGLDNLDNDGARDTNADGHIVLSSDRPDRTLVVLNQRTMPVCEPGVELLANGNFETPVVTNGAQWDIFPAGTPGLGWLVDWVGNTTLYNSVSRPQVANLELHRGVNGWATSEGAQYAELDTDWNGHAGALNNEPASVAIHQYIPTVPNETYNLSFDFSPRPGTAANENTLAVYWGGSLIDTIAPTTTGSQTNWTTHTYALVATTTMTSLKLVDVGTENSVGTFVDNASLKCAEEVCEPHTITVVSDTQTQVDEHNAVALSFIHPAWTASIPGATWIWEQNGVANPTADDIQEFTRTFTVDDTPASATLQIASDNSYEVWVNGQPIGGNPSTSHYSSATQETYTDGALLAALVEGSNTLTIKVKNFALGGGTAQSNPAGLLYKLSVTTTCEEPPAPVPTLAIQKAGSYNSATNQLTFTIGWSVNGAGNAANVVITDALPAGTTFVSADNGGVESAGTVTWNLGAQSAGASGTVTLVVSLNAGASMNQWASSVVSATQGLRKNNTPVLAARSSTTMMLGPAQNNDTENFYALGFGGSTTLAFDQYFLNGAGDDIVVTETSYGAPTDVNYPEKVAVYGSVDGVSWTYLGQDIQDGAFNMDLGPLAVAKYLKFVDVSDKTSSKFPADADGFDIDAVKVNYPTPNVCTVANTASIAADGIAATSSLATVGINELVCEPEEPEEPVCDEGYHYDGEECVPNEDDPEDPVCDEGETLVLGQCVTVEDPDPEQCPSGSHQSGQGCVPNEDDDDDDPPPSSPTDVCPNLNGIQTSIPSGYYLNPQGQCANVGNGSVPVYGPQGFVLGASIGTGGDTSCTPYLGSYLKKGAKNDPEEVKKLQTFLNQYMGSGLEVNGIFDDATFEAVKAFQKLHGIFVLKPWVQAGMANSEEPTGYVYKTTKRWINILMCPTLLPSTPIPPLP